MAPGDPPEDQLTIKPSSAPQVTADYAKIAATINRLGVEVATLKTQSEGRFPDLINAALPKIGRALTDIGLRAHGISASAQQQVDLEAQYLPDHTRGVQDLNAAKLAAIAAAKNLSDGNVAPQAGANQLTSATQGVEAARARLQGTWDTAQGNAAQYAAPIPGHTSAAKTAAQDAVNAQIVQSGPAPASAPESPSTVAPSQPMPSVLNQVKPSGNKPTENKSSSPNKPSENKNSVDDPTANKNTPPNAQTPQGQLPQSAGAQQGQPQQGGAAGAPTAGGAGAPQGQQPRTNVAPVVSPVRAGDIGGGRGSNPSVRPTPSTPKLTPAQQAGLSGRTAPLGSGTGATGGGGISQNPAAANKGGITPSGTGSSTSNGTSGARGPMGTMMGAGAGHGAGGQGTVRPKGEVKSRDPRMQGEDIASQAIGGVYRDGPADGAPTPPAVPGAPTPPTPPTPTAR